MIIINLKKRKIFCVLKYIAICGLAAFFTWGCARPVPPSCPQGSPKPYRVGKKWYQPLAHSRDFRQRGLASWYGKKFHGRKTSSGEVYNMYAMTAAHKTLPLGTWVRIHNLKNNREVEVRINDRGPFVRGRIVDLSYSAAKKLGVVGPGTAPVEIIALGTSFTQKVKAGETRKYIPIDYYAGKFTFQVGAFKDGQNAEKLRNRLSKKYRNAHIKRYHNGYDTFYRVRVGRCSGLHQATEYEKKLIRSGFKDAFVVAE